MNAEGKKLVIERLENQLREAAESAQRAASIFGTNRESRIVAVSEPGFRSEILVAALAASFPAAAFERKTDDLGRTVIFCDGPAYVADAASIFSEGFLQGSQLERVRAGELPARKAEDQ